MKDIRLSGHLGRGRRTRCPLSVSEPALISRMRFSFFFFHRKHHEMDINLVGNGFNVFYNSESSFCSGIIRKYTKSTNDNFPYFSQ